MLFGPVPCVDAIRNKDAWEFPHQIVRKITEESEEITL